MMLQMVTRSNSPETVKKGPAKADRQIIGGAGRRVTRQRAVLLDIIRKSKSHMDADEVYRLARDQQPQLSLSTVYRTLRLFKEMGLVEETHFAEEHHHYEVKSEKEHHHLVCLKCGKVIEFSYPLSRKLRENVPETKDFEITGTEIRIMGLCADCKDQT
jgi:Fur family transcriptional regulator, ferric uptake regulator